MKDKKGAGKIIAQSVCNLADNLYDPNKVKMVFDQKVSLKFHKSHSFENLLKPHAVLNLSIKSILQNDGMECDLLDTTLTPRTATKTIDRRNYLTSAGESMISDGFFDGDISLNLGDDLDHFLFDQSPISKNSTMSKISRNVLPKDQEGTTASGLYSQDTLNR